MKQSVIAAPVNNALKEQTGGLLQQRDLFVGI